MSLRAQAAGGEEVQALGSSAVRWSEGAAAAVKPWAGSGGGCRTRGQRVLLPAPWPVRCSWAQLGAQAPLGLERGPRHTWQLYICCQTVCRCFCPLNQKLAAPHRANCCTFSRSLLYIALLDLEVGLPWNSLFYQEQPCVCDQDSGFWCVVLAMTWILQGVWMSAVLLFASLACTRAHRRVTPVSLLGQQTLLQYKWQLAT